MEFIIEFLAKQIVNIFPNLKTKFVGIVTFLVGLLSFLTTTTFVQDLCKNFGFCIEGNKAYGIFLTVLGFIILVVRKATELYNSNDETI